MSEYLVLPWHTTLGLLTLIVYPLLVQLWFFGPSRDATQWSASALIGSATLTVACLLTGLAGIFNFWTATVLALVLICLTRWGIKQWPRLSVLGEGLLTEPRIGRTEIAVLVLFFLFALGGLIIRRYPYNSDTFRKYLGGGADLLENRHIATLNLEEGNLGYSNAPVAMLFNGYIFSLWGINDEFSRGIPVFFTLLTVLLLMAWAKEEGPQVAVIAAVGAFAASQVIFRSYIAILQEPPLLFFTTHLFYWFRRLLQHRTMTDYAFLVLAAAMAMLSKYSALIPVVLVGGAGLLTAPRSWRHRLAYVLLYASPTLLWLGRNWLIWGNPIYPFLDGIFHSNLYTYGLLSAEIVAPYIAQNWVPLGGLLKDLALSFTFIPFALMAWWPRRRQVWVWLYLACFALVLVMLRLQGSRSLERYFYFCTGVYAVYAGVGITTVYQHLIARRWSLPQGVWLTGLALLLVAELAMLYWKHPVPYYLEQRYEHVVLEYLQRHVPPGGTVTVLGDSGLVTWYDRERDYNIWRFHTISYLIRSQGKCAMESPARELHDCLAQAGVEYLYRPPGESVYQEFWETVSATPDYFFLVLDAEGARVWQVNP